MSKKAHFGYTVIGILVIALITIHAIGAFGNPEGILKVSLLLAMIVSSVILGGIAVEIWFDYPRIERMKEKQGLKSNIGFRTPFGLVIITVASIGGIFLPVLKRPVCGGNMLLWFAALYLIICVWANETTVSHKPAR